MWFQFKIDTYYNWFYSGPLIWNNFLTKSETSYTSIDIFENRIKEKSLNFPNKLLLFQIYIYTSNSIFLLCKTLKFALGLDDKELSLLQVLVLQTYN